MLERQAKLGAEAPGQAWRAIRDDMASFYRLFLSLRDLPCPTIAAIQGAAVGAGLCVALGCDFRYVAGDAQLGLNFARLGVHPGMAATWTLPRLIGPAQAAELLYTGRLIDGAEAHRIGLANRVLPAAEVLPAALATAREIAANAPIAVRAIKQACGAARRAHWKISCTSRPPSRPEPSKPAMPGKASRRSGSGGRPGSTVVRQESAMDAPQPVIRRTERRRPGPRPRWVSSPAQTFR